MPASAGSTPRQRRTGFERNPAELRLIDGEPFVEMVLELCASLSPRYRSLIPFKQIHVPVLCKG